jgi:LacI family transcriptional regulator
VWLHEPNLTPEGIRRRLLARGIRGILVFPQLAPGAYPAFSWDDFSAVALGYSVTSPQLHRITNHQFRSALILLRELRGLGYRRIGFYLPEEYDRRVNLGPSSAYAAYDRTLPPEERVPILFQHYMRDIPRFSHWLKTERPDVVICQNFHLWDWFIANDLRIPEDVGLAFLNIGREEKLLSGVHQSDHQIGSAAFDFLVAMLHRNERGVPAIAQHVLIDGIWLPRQSTRRVGPPAPWFLDIPVPPLPMEASPEPHEIAPKPRGASRKRK